MAYNPKNDLNEIAYLKNIYQSSDKGGKAWAEDQAKKYYKNLIDNNRADLAERMKQMKADTAFSFSKGYNDAVSKNPYAVSSYDTAKMLNGYRENTRKSIDAAADKAAAQYGGQAESINNYYDDAAKKYYMQYIKDSKALPQRLAAMGITGGASESSLMGLNADYANQVSDLEKQRAEALAQNDNAVAQIRAEADMKKADTENDLSQLEYNMYLNNRDYNNENYWKQKNFDYQKYIEDMQAQQNEWQRKQTERAYEDERLDKEYDKMMNTRSFELDKALKMAQMGYFGDLSSILGCSPDEAERIYYNNIGKQYMLQYSFKNAGKGGGSSKNKGTVKSTGTKGSASGSEKSSVTDNTTLPVF